MPYLIFIQIFIRKVIVYYFVLCASYWILFRAVTNIDGLANQPLVSYIVAFIAVVLALIYSLKSKNPNETIKIRSLLLDVSLAIFIILAFYLERIINNSNVGLLQINSVPIGNIFTSNIWPYQALIVSFCLSVMLVQFGRYIKINSSLKYAPVIIFLIGTIAYSFLTIQRHRLYHSFAMDLGGYDQAIWLLSQLKVPISSIYHLSNYIGDHFEPILFGLAPLYWIWNDVRTLLIAQSLVVMLGIFPVFGLAKKYLGQWPALIMSLSYVLFIGMQYAVEYDFHTLTLVAPFLAYALYFFDNKRNIGYWISIILILCARSEVSLYIVFLGIFAVSKKRWLTGIITIILGIVWYIFSIKIMIPNLVDRPYIYLSGFQGLGNNTTEIIMTIFTKPLYILQILLTPSGKVSTFLLIYSSFSFIPFLAPVSFILALPMLGEKFLATDRESNWQIWWHYSVTILPAIIYGSILGIKFVSNKYVQIRKQLIAILCCMVLIMTISVSFFYSSRPPWPAPLLNLFSKSYYKRPEHLGKLDIVLDNIPPEVSIATQDVVLPHVAHREEIYRLGLESTPETDYVIMDFSINHWPMSDEQFSVLFDSYLNNQPYSLEVNDYPIFVFRRN